MTDLQEKAMRLALERLESHEYWMDERAIQALRTALAQPANSTTNFVEPKTPVQPEQECTCSAKDMPFGKCCKVKLEQEPVAWMYALNDNVGEIARTVVKERFNLSVTSPYGREGIDYAQGMTVKEFPLYTAPPSIEAAELRRLHEVNQMLVEALNGLIDANQSEGAAPGGFSLKGPTREHQQRVFDAWQKIGQALAKAKEQA